MNVQEQASSSAAVQREEGEMLARGQQGTQGLHRCNSYFAMLPQPFMRTLWTLQDLPTVVLHFLNPPYFDVFISGLFCFILFFNPSASHCWGQGRADGQLCKHHKWKADGKGEVTRHCWWGQSSQESPLGQTDCLVPVGHARGLSTSQSGSVMPAACRAMSSHFASQEGPRALWCS